MHDQVGALVELALWSLALPVSAVWLLRALVALAKRVVWHG